MCRLTGRWRSITCISEMPLVLTTYFEVPIKEGTVSRQYEQEYVSTPKYLATQKDSYSKKDIRIRGISTPQYG